MRGYFTPYWAADESTVVGYGYKDFRFDGRFLVWDIEHSIISVDIPEPECDPTCNFWTQPVRRVDGRFLGFERNRDIEHSRMSVDMWDIEAQEIIATFSAENESTSWVVNHSFRWHPQNDQLFVYDTEVVDYEAPLDDPSGSIMVWSMGTAEDEFALVTVLDRPPRNFGYSSSYRFGLGTFTGENAIEWSRDGSMIAHGGNGLDDDGIIVWQNDGD